MQQLITVLGSFPQKDFSTMLDEKIAGIKNLNPSINESDIQDIKERLGKLYELDKIINIDLLNLVRENESLELSQEEISEVYSLIDEITILNSYLQNNLNLTNPNNHINLIFQNFFLKVDTSLLAPITVNIRGHNVATGEKLVDIKINRVNALIEKIKTKSGIGTNVVEGQNIANTLIQNKDKITEGLKLITQLNQESQKNIQLNLDKHAVNFGAKSSEYKSGYSNENFLIFDNILTNFLIQQKKVKALSSIFSYLKSIRRNPSFKGRDVWLVFAILMGLIVFVIIFSFIEVIGNQKDISIGVAILRISALIVPGYFGFFCIGEYTKAKRLYEKYQFKNIAIETMNKLLISYTEREERKEILSKGIDIIFSEPLEKEDTSSLKGYIGDLKDIAKSRLSG